MRRVAHCSVYFPEISKGRILSLMRIQCSALRSAYQGVQKYGLSGNDLKKYVKARYMCSLNQRYIADICVTALSIKKEKVIFGGKRSWKKLLAGSITKEEWQKRRNNQLYSRGDRSKKGNPNIRIDVSKNLVYINDPAGRGRWIEGKLFIPRKYRDIDISCYDCRLMYKKDRFILNISYEVPSPEEIVYGLSQGVIGIDVNPSEAALVETNSGGNLIRHFSLKYPRIAYAGYYKRKNDISLLAKDIVSYALSCGKSIVVENLEFNEKKKRKNKKFNRMRHNFCYRKILEAIESRAIRQGVRVIKVDPAFSSIIGRLKYSHIYYFNRHTGAAFVIARRGMGIKERNTLKISKVGGKWNLEGRYLSSRLTTRAMTYLKEFLHIDETVLTGLCLAVDNSTRSHEAGGIPASQSALRTGRSSDNRNFASKKEQEEPEISVISGQ